ncbi:hypothetical protein ACJ72_08174, partial [Emergomyces africanus]
QESMSWARGLDYPKRTDGIPRVKDRTLRRKYRQGSMDMAAAADDNSGVFGKGVNAGNGRG